MLAASTSVCTKTTEGYEDVLFIIKIHLFNYSNPVGPNAKITYPSQCQTSMQVLYRANISSMQVIRYSNGLIVAVHGLQLLGHTKSPPVLLC